MYKGSIYNNFVSIDNKTYVYNTFSKAFLLIDNENKFEDFIKSYKSNYELNNADNKVMMDILINNGFVVDCEIDELNYVEYIYNKVYFNSDTLNIILVPTLNCNFKCPYCFEEGKRNFKVNKEYFQILKRYSDNNFKFFNHVHISLFGGEPLLKEKDMFDYLEYIYNKKNEYGIEMSTSIVTNGSLVTEEVVEKLKKYSCKYFQITLDGDESLHNKIRIFEDGKESFKLLIDKINLVAKLSSDIEDFKLTVRINLKNINIEKIEETLLKIDYKYRSNINILFRPIYSTSEFIIKNKNTTNDLKQFYDIAIKLGFKIIKNNFYYKSCEACGDAHEFYITPDLRLWKCINDLDYEDACIGNINDNGQINFDSNKIVKWNQAANCFKDSECIKCSKLPDCYGGCILYNSKNAKRKCKDFEMASLPFFY